MNAVGTQRMTIPRLPRRHAPVLFALVTSVLISGLMSAVLTATNTGVDAGYIARWLRAYALAWALAFPIVTVLARIIHRTARNRPRPPNTWARDFIAKNFIKQPIRIVVNDIKGLALTAHFS